MIVLPETKGEMRLRNAEWLTKQLQRESLEQETNITILGCDVGRNGTVHVKGRYAVEIDNPHALVGRDYSPCYDGVIEFVASFQPGKEIDEFKLRFVGEESRKKARKYGLRECLEEAVALLTLPIGEDEAEPPMLKV